jgi:hypothetical protein
LATQYDKTKSSQDQTGMKGRCDDPFNNVRVI